MRRRLGRSVGALMLAVVACGGDDDTTGSGAPATTASTAPVATTSTTAAVTTTSTAAEGLSEATLRGLDYAAALTDPAALGFIPATFEARSPFDVTDTSLRRQCGEVGRSPTYAVAGLGQELLDGDGLASLTTSVQAFADVAAARDAFAFAEDGAEACTTWSSEGDDFVRVDPPLIPDAGDDSFSLFSRKPATGLLVADHFVRLGPFVFNVRYAVSGVSPLVGSGATLAQIAETGDERFLTWADEQLS